MQQAGGGNFAGAGAVLAVSEVVQLAPAVEQVRARGAEALARVAAWQRPWK